MSAATALLRSHCVQTRYGRLYLALTALVGAVLAGVTGAVLLSEQLPGPGAALLILGLGLLVAMVPLFRRAQFPLDVALTAEGLALTPVGRSLKLGVPAETLPLPGIRGYSQTEQGPSLTLTLYLDDSRTLALTDKPRRLNQELEAGFVPLAALSAALQTQLAAAGSGAEARPNFFQGLGGQILAGICAVCFAAGLVLLFVPGVEWTQGLRLLTFSSIYLGMYLRNRKPRPTAG